MSRFGLNDFKESSRDCAINLLENEFEKLIVAVIHNNII